jgi:hypothetical protein
MEGVMRRQGPERTDPVDSSVVSDSVEVNHPIMKGHKRKINGSNFGYSNRNGEKVMTLLFVKYEYYSLTTI